MPVSPELARDLAKHILEIYTRAEELLLQQVARRLARGVDAPGGPESLLLQVQAVRVEAERVAAQLDGQAAEEIDRAVRTAYNRGVATAGSELAGQGGSAAAMAFGVVNDRAVAELVRAAHGITDQLHLQVVRATVDAFRTASNDAAAQVLVGTLTRREASARMVGRLAASGLRFADSAGRRWELGSYAEMAVRTVAGQAAVQGHLDRLAEQGRDLVIVSDAPEECRLCRPWEGRVLSISGRSTVDARNPLTGRVVAVHVAGSMATARAAGLFHPNCRHSVSLYLPGVTRVPTRTADPEGDALRQRQRALERRVRTARRRTAVAKAARNAAGGKLDATDPLQRAYQRAVRLQQAATGDHDAFVAEHDRKRLGYRLNPAAR